MENIIRLKRKPNWVGNFRIEYDSKYITLFGEIRDYPIKSFSGEFTGYYDETVLVYDEELIDVRDASPEIIEITDKEIVISLNL